MIRRLANVGANQVLLDSSVINAQCVFVFDLVAFSCAIVNILIVDFDFCNRDVKLLASLSIDSKLLNIATQMGVCKR